MDPGKAIFTAGLVTSTSVLAGTMAPKSYGGHGSVPSARMLIGLSLSFLGLSIMADIAPSVAVPLAATVSVTALTYYGVPVADKFFTGQTPEQQRGTNP